MHIKHAVAAMALAATLFGGAASAEQPWYKLPTLPPPDEYGNLLITRMTANTNVPAVTFSHWRHRLQYTCRVCHLELEFSMKLNETEITEERSRNGEFCGACHDGEKAFGHSRKHCKKCHTGEVSSGRKHFRALGRLPRDSFGNQIDWVKALDRGIIKPRLSVLDDSFAPMPFGKKFEVRSKLSMVPPAVFSHDAHLKWLDCANCHPDVFNIKKNTTQLFSMDAILHGRFCGACHLNVAFPLDDCNRCHPKIRE